MSRKPNLRLVDTGFEDPARAGRTSRSQRQRQRRAKKVAADAQARQAERKAVWTKEARPRTAGQQRAQEAMRGHDMVFLTGPAGTGKTYLAVAQAVAMLMSGEVERIVLSRPAVEAGERLGFLPGDLRDKVDPYMRPLYDALLCFMNGPQLKAYLDNLTIEVAPLAFLRGRTLSHAFIILDEAQNATHGQIKMVVTRLGEGARMVVAGDPTQTDLDEGASGLADIAATLDVEGSGVGVVRLEQRDVVRHRTVRKVVELLDAA
jgi:phosphate starvation-inducible PhoH-like protein